MKWGMRANILHLGRWFAVTPKEKHNATDGTKYPTHDIHDVPIYYWLDLLHEPLDAFHVESTGRCDTPRGHSNTHVDDATTCSVHDIR